MRLNVIVRTETAYPLSLMLATSAYIMPMVGVGCFGRHGERSSSSRAATRRFCKRKSGQRVWGRLSEGKRRL